MHVCISELVRHCSEFQTVGPAIENARRPFVLIRVREMVQHNAECSLCSFRFGSRTDARKNVE